MAVLIERPERPIGLAFVMDGRGGFKEQPYIRTFVRSFLDNNYLTVSFDTTNSFGESEGTFSEATPTNYYEDFEDVINWARQQDWYQEPFILCGHSLGGMCVSLYAEKYPDKVKALVPISTVVSGQLFIEAYDPKEIENWRKTGWFIYTGYVSGNVKKLKWAFMEDCLKYDLLPEATKLTMPVLMIAGESDINRCPLKHQEMLFKALVGRKELRVIKNGPHTFKEPKHLQEISSLISKWLQSVK